MSVDCDGVTVKLVPADFAVTANVDAAATVPKACVVKRISEFAVTAELLTTVVAAPASTNVPAEHVADDVAAMTSLFPAVLKTRLPLVAVMLPNVAVILVPALTAPAVATILPVVDVMPVPAVTVVPAVREPADAAIFPAVAVMFPADATTFPRVRVRLPAGIVVLPVALPILTAPVPPTPMFVVAAPELLMFAVPTCVKAANVESPVAVRVVVVKPPVNDSPPLKVAKPDTLRTPKDVVPVTERVPLTVSFVVTVKLPGATKVDERLNVIVLPEPVVLICEPVPAKVMLLPEGDIGPPLSPVNVFRAPPIDPSVTQLAARTPPTEVNDVRAYAMFPRVLIQRLPTGKFTSEVVGARLLINGTSTFSGATPKATG